MYSISKHVLYIPIYYTVQAISR